MSADVRQALEQFRAECVRLRMGAQLPGVHAAPETMLDCLLDVRQRLDRVEELLRNALQLRAMAARQHTVTRFAAEDAWDTVAVAQRNNAARDEYSSAKERAAVANLEVIDLRRTERAAADLSKFCEETVEYVRLCHRGLADVRQDALAVIRAQQFESTLDR